MSTLGAYTFVVPSNPGPRSSTPLRSARSMRHLPPLRTTAQMPSSSRPAYSWPTAAWAARGAVGVDPAVGDAGDRIRGQEERSNDERSAERHVLWSA
jgi:hypothetical protein